MFRFHKPLDIITVFHKSGTPASVKAVNLLKQVSANSTTTATEDQASDHTAQTHPKRPQFELNVTEDPPTADQLQTILEYVGRDRIPSVIPGSTTQNEAMKRFIANPEVFKRPVVVDWNNGKAVATENESEILKMVGDVKFEE